MGILRRLTRRTYKENEAPNVAWDQTEEGNEGAEREVMEYEGTAYECVVNTSENGEWEAAFGLAEDRSHQRLFLFREGVLYSTVELKRPKLCAVANNGTTLVASRADWQEIGGEVIVFDREGDQILIQSCESNISRVAITPNGRYGAALVLKPTCKTYLFDCVGGEVVGVHENHEGNKQLAKFQQVNNEWHLYLSHKDREHPLYAIDMSGEITWKSDRFREEPFSLLKWLKSRM
jgi:hypothetical protein